MNTIFRIAGGSKFSARNQIAAIARAERTRTCAHAGCTGAMPGRTPQFSEPRVRVLGSHTYLIECAKIRGLRDYVLGTEATFSVESIVRGYHAYKLLLER